MSNVIVLVTLPVSFAVCFFILRPELKRRNGKIALGVMAAAYLILWIGNLLIAFGG